MHLVRMTAHYVGSCGLLVFYCCVQMAPNLVAEQLLVTMSQFCGLTGLSWSVLLWVSHASQSDMGWGLVHMAGSER